jgi:F420-dependent methylenetetrahydromethanopterin dehydrogenase
MTKMNIVGFVVLACAGRECKQGEYEIVEEEQKDFELEEWSCDYVIIIAAISAVPVPAAVPEEFRGCENPCHAREQRL